METGHLEGPGTTKPSSALWRLLEGKKVVQGRSGAAPARETMRRRSRGSQLTHQQGTKTPLWGREPRAGGESPEEC